MLGGGGGGGGGESWLGPVPCPITSTKKNT